MKTGRNKLKSFLAMLLVVTMMLQQSGIGVFAADIVNTEAASKEMVSLPEDENAQELAETDDKTVTPTQTKAESSEEVTENPAEEPAEEPCITNMPENPAITEKPEEPAITETPKEFETTETTKEPETLEGAEKPEIPNEPENLETPEKPATTEASSGDGEKKEDIQSPIPEMTETSTPEPKKTKKLAAKAALADVEIGTGDPVNLLNIKSDIQANATTSVDEVKRGGELHFALSYKIDDNKIKEAKAASAWTYDISSLLSSHGGIFKSLTQDVVGEIYDGTNYAGTYEVVNGIVYLKIDPRYWATGKESNVGGTFNLYCKLDSEAIKTDEEKEISFPGSGDFIDITFEDVVTSADKKVNGKTGNAGIVKLNQDGTIKYTLSFYVNADLDSLSVTDILGPGQTIKDGKVTIKDSKGKTKTIVVSPDGDGRFTVDFGAQFNRELLANGTYSLEYNVTVDNDGWNTALTNQASWNWNGANNTPPNNTTITPQKDIASKKVVKGATITNPDGTKKTVFTYTLMVGDGKLDLRGYHIKDIMSKNQTLTSNITMTGGGSSQTLTPLNTPSGNNLILFDYTFPTDGNPLYGPYTITYTTENIGADLSGKQDIKNELDTTPPGSNVTEKDNTSEGVDYGTPGKEPTPTLDKKFESLDGENKEISWVLTVNVPAGKSFTNIKVHEDEYTYTNAQGQKRSMALDWTKTSVTDADGNRLDASYYTIDAANNNVIFAVLDKTVKIKVVTKFDGDKNTYFKNHAQLFDDNVHLDDGQDEYRIAYDFPISKNVSYDSGAKQYVWKITINQDKKNYVPDLTVYIKDILPEGMEYVKDSFRGSKNDNWNTSFKAAYDSETRVLVSGDLGTLSKNKYYCEYRTVLTDDALKEIETKNYTNHVELYDTGNVKLNETEKTVTVTRKHLSKEGGTLKADLIPYTIEVNKDELDLDLGDSITLTDHLPSSVDLLAGKNGAVTFTDKNGAAVAGASFKFINGDLILTVPDQMYVKIQYTVRVKDLGNQNISNMVEFTGKVHEAASYDRWYNVVEHSSIIHGSKDSINFRKTNETLDTPLDGAEFTIYTVSYTESGAIGTPVFFTKGVTSNGGTLEIAKLAMDTLYCWQETKAPTGYEITDSSYHYFILYTKESAAAVKAIVNIIQSANPGIAVESSSEGILANVTDDLIRFIDIEGLKVWDDNDNAAGVRPDSVQLKLQKKNGDSWVDVPGKTVAATKASNWSYKFEHLDKFDEDKAEIEYRVVETNVPPHYASVPGTAEGNWVVTNSLEVTKHTVIKKWQDGNNQDGLRPSSIRAQLFADGEAYGTEVELNAANDWTYTWTNLPKRAAGADITYTVEETEVPDEYEVSYSEDTFTITNTHIPYVTSKTVTKVWEDAENQDGIRPTGIKVQLYADGETYGTEVELNAANDWTYTWTNLPKKIAGKDIIYTVEETEVPDGYEAGYSEDTFTITNTHIPYVTERTVTKVWEDAENQDGLRPTGIKVQLYADGEAYGAEVELNAANDWTYTWTNLPKRAAGADITYTVEETEVPDEYEVSYSEDTFTITNTHIPEVLDKTVIKRWVNDSETSRPEKITVQLLADGEKFGAPAELTAENGWTYTWTNLDKYKNEGQEIVYTAEEIDVPTGYITSYSEDTFTITNTGIHFRVNKVDLDGNAKEVAGAQLSIYTADNMETPLDTWISAEGENHDFGPVLTKGQSYILREDFAPAGYMAAADIEFTVGEDGSISVDAKRVTDEDGNTVYLVEDKATAVTVTKLDATTEEELAGATLQIVDAAGMVVEEWVTDGTPHVITAKLIFGAEYTLIEKEAPEGYEIAEPITFTVNADPEENQVVMLDAMPTSEEAVIAVTKDLKLNDESFNAVDKTFYVALFADEACTKRVSDIKAIEFKNASSSTVEFTGVEIGRTYYVSEVGADGEVVEVGVTEDGKTYVPYYPEGKTAKVETEDGRTILVFENQFVEWPDGFYKVGKLNITKKLLGADGKDLESDEIFYAGIFADEDHTILSDRTETNIVELNLNGNSSVTETVTLDVLPGESYNLYVTEVDKDGKPVADAPDFKYNVTEDGEVVFLDGENLEASVIITNQVKEEKPTPTPKVTATPAPEATPTPKEAKKPDVKTGDDTPIGLYVTLLFGAAAMVLGGTAYRRRRKSEK